MKSWCSSVHRKKGNFQKLTIFYQRENSIYRNTASWNLCLLQWARDWNFALCVTKGPDVVQTAELWRRLGELQRAECEWKMDREMLEQQVKEHQQQAERLRLLLADKESLIQKLHSSIQSMVSQNLTPVSSNILQVKVKLISAKNSVQFKTASPKTL